MRKRYLQDRIAEDLEEKMVFLAGPRQVGKTTLANQILENDGPGEYLSWDNRADRGAIRTSSWPPGEALIVLDEVHKWRPWKRWIKGEFDKHRGRLKFLLTGSARMDIYRRGGDSLQGRYHHHRLHPFSLAELERVDNPAPRPGEEIRVTSRDHGAALRTLLDFGGFPEPLLAGSQRTLRRWQKERVDRFFREDVRDLEQVRDLSSMQLLADLLADRVASPLSINSLREDLEVSHKTVARWVDILERLYYVFRVRPFTTRLAQGLKKMPKAYLWDTSLVQDKGARFENLVALHLLKLCHFLEDTEGYRTELRYLRDATGREVDFLVTAGRSPWFMVETKLSETRVDKSLIYFRERTGVPLCYQVVMDTSRDFERHGIRVLPAHRFLAALV